MESACYYLNDRYTQNFKISKEASRLARSISRGIFLIKRNNASKRSSIVPYRRKILRVCVNVSLTGILSLLLLEPVELVQLPLKSLNTPADMLSQLCQFFFFILRLYACSTDTILTASVDQSQNF